MAAEHAGSCSGLPGGRARQRLDHPHSSLGTRVRGASDGVGVIARPRFRLGDAPLFLALYVESVAATLFAQRRVRRMEEGAHRIGLHHLLRRFY